VGHYFDVIFLPHVYDFNIVSQQATCFLSFIVIELVHDVIMNVLLIVYFILMSTTLSRTGSR